MLAAAQAALLLLAAPLHAAPVDSVLDHPEQLTFEEDDSDSCIRYHVPGKLLFYKDTAVHPIGISIPAALVARGVPSKVRTVAPFVGSKKGGDTTEYAFGPTDEVKYQQFYRRHRFAHTQKKGGWDALRHVEILAAGGVPIFQGMADAPRYVVPFVPSQQLLEAEERLLPYSRGIELVYNSTVRSLLSHTHRCMTSESMAARVLRTLGLWPTSRPLKLLYVTCGWGFTSFDDGWQGPVSIGLFLGLQNLLRRHRGSRIIDAPVIKSDFLEEHTQRSHMWYTFERDAGCRFSEENLRRLMYGYGYNYARQIPREFMATPAERDGVRDAIRRREFDAVIYGKVGPTQGCDPLPFMQDIQDAGYPPQRVALIYGGDFGLTNRNISTHMRLMGEFGTVFVREIDAPEERFTWQPARVLPSSCYLDTNWRKFFKLWDMRLKCWGCADIDEAVLDALYPALSATARPTPTSTKFGIERCWGGLALLTFPLLSQRGPEPDNCKFAVRQMLGLRAGIEALGGGAGVIDDFVEAFGLQPVEVYAFICHACDGARGGHRDAQAACREAEGIVTSRSSPFAADFDRGPERLPITDLRSMALVRNRIRDS